MLIQFTFRNFRSFPNETTLSMVAEKLKSQDKALDENNVFAVDDKLSLLTSAAIYGPNASGKSNVIKALEFMRAQVLRVSEGSKPKLSPFLLDAVAAGEPSQFEVVFLANGIRFRYGFEMSADKVRSEWLYGSPTGRQRLVFEREGQSFRFGKNYRYLRGYTRLVRPDYLLLAVLALDTSEDEIGVCFEWFYSLTIVSNLLDPDLADFARQSLLSWWLADGIKNLVSRLDVGINDLWMAKQKESSLEDDVPSRRVRPPESIFDLGDPVHNDDELVIETSHTRFGSEGKPEGEVVFNLDSDESEGTKKLFVLAGLVLVTLGLNESKFVSPKLGPLQTATVLVIDELDARLHTRLTREIVGLFNDRRTNPDHAQLIFTAHDTNLLNNRLFRRDQIWFVEKDLRGASQLYSLAEFKGVRNDKDFESGYMQGQYGALPFVTAIREAVIETYGSAKKE